MRQGGSPASVLAMSSSPWKNSDLHEDCLMATKIVRLRLAGPFLFGIALACGGRALEAATPTAEQALRLAPVQKDVEYDRPEDPSKCTIKAEKRKGQTGWLVRDVDGKILREFVDTNGDNIVD